MNNDDGKRQSYFRILEKKLDEYFHAIVNDEPVEQLNAELKGFLEAGMVLKVTSKDVLDAMIQNRYKIVKGDQQTSDT